MLIHGTWALARRVAFGIAQAKSDREMGITRMTAQPSAEWFATAEEYRQRDAMLRNLNNIKRARGDE
jgi:hypothetical protein